MDVRKKLVELLSQDQSFGVKQGNHITHQEGKTNREIASHLIDNGVTVQEWISVKDRLPEESGEYLCFTKYENFMCLFYSSKHKAFNATDDVSEKHVKSCEIKCSHWMPLPQPPKGE